MSLPELVFILIGALAITAIVWFVGFLYKHHNTVYKASRFRYVPGEHALGPMEDVHSSALNEDTTIATLPRNSVILAYSTAVTVSARNHFIMNLKYNYHKYAKFLPDKLIWKRPNTLVHKDRNGDYYIYAKQGTTFELEAQSHDIEVKHFEFVTTWNLYKKFFGLRRQCKATEIVSSVMES